MMTGCCQGRGSAGLEGCSHTHGKSHRPQKPSGEEWLTASPPQTFLARLRVSSSPLHPLAIGLTQPFPLGSEGLWGDGGAVEKQALAQAGWTSPATSGGPALG